MWVARPRTHFELGAALASASWGGGTGLLLGEVTGDSVFDGRELLPHRRPVCFDRVVPRGAVRPPASMQDPRSLFRVTVDPAAVGPAGR